MDNGDPNAVAPVQRADNGPARVLPLSRRERRALGDVARSLRGIQKLPAPRARAAIEKALLFALEQFDTNEGAEALLGARGKDVLCTACESLNPLESKAVRLWLAANSDTRDDLVYELDQLLTGWRETLAAAAPPEQPADIGGPAPGDEDEDYADQPSENEAGAA